MSLIPSRTAQAHFEYERIRTLPHFPNNQGFKAFKDEIEKLRGGGENIVIASVEGWGGFNHDPPADKGFVLFLPGEGPLRAIIFTTWNKEVVKVGDLSEQEVAFSGYRLGLLHFTNICLLRDATREYFGMKTGLSGLRSWSLNLTYEIYTLLENDPLQTRVSRELARCPVLARELPKEIAEFVKETIDPALAEIEKLGAEVEKRRRILECAQTFLAAVKEG